MTNQEIALKYLPHFMADKRDPFPIKKIGFTVFHRPGQSLSCTRFLDWEDKTIRFVVEYAVFFDFDIQHMYDLEHVFVYVGCNGEVVDIELSCHGKFLRGMIRGVTQIQEKTHPVVYMQPGKHAMMASWEYFQLFIGLYEVCNKQAGADGFLIAPMFQHALSTDKETDEKISAYIKKNYSFVPTMQFIPALFQEPDLISYHDLEESIIIRMNDWKKKILRNLNE